MTRVFEATCSGKIVQVPQESIPAVLDAIIVGSGVGPSEGVILIFRDATAYIPNVSPDIKATIEQLISITQKVASILTNIGGGMTGPTTAPPPSLPTDVVELGNMVAQLTALKESLR